jgi:hypothetical protein
MALQKQGKKTSAIASFKTVVNQFPQSDEAPMAVQRLHSLGITAKLPAKRSAR